MRQVPVYSRKKILLQAAAFFAGLPVIRFFSRKDLTNDETIIMLSENGELVKVDKKRLTAPVKKVNNDELQRWIKKNTDEWKVKKLQEENL
jgi:hypothetical protein